MPRVLIVDDEPEVRAGVCRWLSRAGFTSTTASDGCEVWSALQTAPPDAIVLDVRMPCQDGFTTLREVRSDVRTRRIPVIVLSASMTDGRRALELGARFFISKPYVGQDLVDAVRVALSTRPSYEVYSENQPLAN
jgi:two-component system OmpR family response regulator/two-component system phosphate regulon response regulator OmpR